MQSEEKPNADRLPGRLSLIVPMVRGDVLDHAALMAYRRPLDLMGGCEPVEVVIVGDPADLHAVGFTKTDDSGWTLRGGPVTLVPAIADDWGVLARIGLDAATGDSLIVLDMNRNYPADSLPEVLDPVAARRSDLAIAVPPTARSRVRLARLLRALLGVASRVVLGSSDVFSGLFAVHRGLWEQGGRRLAASESSLVLELLLRRPSRCVDVRVPVGPEFRPGRFRLQDLRPVKHVLDGRYGSWSRLIQFCCVGASGMVVDLSLYALMQLVLSFTPLATAQSPRFGISWSLAVARAVAISVALVWNFSLNRRLTFNDARARSWVRQFPAYVLSNSLAIVLNFVVSVYLPSHFGFFARHKLAAAVVGIIAATGISFSMSRWIVFARRPDRSAASVGPGQPQVSSPSLLA